MMEGKILLAFALLSVLTSANTAVAQPNSPINFQQSSVTNLPATAAPSDIVAGDFDHDGERDFAVSERGLNRVAVYIQGNSGFLTPAAATAAAGRSPSSLVAVSLTANGATDDLVVASGPDGSLIPILNSWPNQPLGLTPLGFSTYRNQNQGQNPRIVSAFYNQNNPLTSFVIADDQTQRPGLLSARYGGNTSFAYGNPALSPGGITAPPCVSVSDMDGDAFLDLLTTSPDNNQVAIFYNANCSYGCWFEGGYRILWPSGGTRPIDVQPADINQDFLPDFITANAGTPNFTYSLSLGTAGRQFNPPVGISLPATPRRLLVADLNGDNAPDVIVLCADNTVRIFRNTGLNGPARFVLDVTLPTGLNPSAMVLADFNNDQTQDLAVSCAGDNTVHVYRNVQGPLATRPSKLTGVAVFPNPATDHLEVMFPLVNKSNIQVRLLDLMGRIALQQMLRSGETIISTAGLPRGLYTLQVLAPTGTHTQRVLLE